MTLISAAGQGDSGDRDLNQLAAASITQDVIVMPAQFDFSEGDGLDAAFLGTAQTDREDNVNVSRCGPKRYQIKSGQAGQS